MPLLVRILGVLIVLFLCDERGFSPRLKLDRVGACFSGRIDEPPAEVHVSVMVGTYLGNDVRGITRPDDNVA
jgi:hypothetical protein